MKDNSIYRLPGSKKHYKSDLPICIQQIVYVVVAKYKVHTSHLKLRKYLSFINRHEKHITYTQILMHHIRIKRLLPNGARKRAHYVSRTNFL
jgi:hypothetical protein